MKYAIVIPDGAADEPQAELGGKTPLEAAHTPNLDALATEGLVGRSNNVPSHLPAGSAVANMSLFGYDPTVNFTGRAPLEAVAQNIKLGPHDWAIRCNLVTIQDQKMRDFTADHIRTQEAKLLLTSLQEAVQKESRFSGVLEFITGISYRNLLVWRGDKKPAPFSADTRTRPPHDLTDKTILNDFPRGPGCGVLVDLMKISAEVFANHPVNKARQKTGQGQATNIWLWGEGRTPGLQPFSKVYGHSGTMITAVDLLRGIAQLIGWKRLEVTGATGYTDTDYAAKGQAAIARLPDTEVICVHIEAPDEASHEGDCAGKVKAIEEIDRHIVGPLVAALKEQGEWRILVSPDHPTPLRTKTHSHGAVPFLVAGTGVTADRWKTYGDSNAAASERSFTAGWQLMRWFLTQEE